MKVVIEPNEVITVQKENYQVKHTLTYPVQLKVVVVEPEVLKLVR